MIRFHLLLPASLRHRLLLLFVLTALVPLGALAMYALSSVHATLSHTRQIELVHASKSMGMTVVEHLQDVTAFVVSTRDVSADAVTATTRIAQGLGDKLAGLALLKGDRLIASYGRLPPLPATPAVLPGPIVAISASADAPRLFLVVPATVDGLPAKVAVLLNDDYLWGDPDEFPLMTDFAVLTDDGRPLFGPHQTTPQANPAIDAALRQHGHSGVLTLDAQGAAPMFVGYWTLSLTRFGDPSIVIAAIQPRAYTLAPIDAFARAFVPIAILSALAAALLALVQIRRVLRPLAALKAAAARVANNDFSASVDVPGEDEVAELGKSFNTMSSHLWQQFDTLYRYGEIDRMVLTQIDPEQAIGSALDGIQAATGVNTLQLLIEERATPQLYRLTRSTDAGAPHAERVASEPLPGWPGDDDWRVLASTELPAGLLASATMTPFYQCSAVRRTQSHQLALVIPAQTPDELHPVCKGQVDGFLDRIAIALSTADRERELVKRARYDALTGLPNRYEFFEKLNAAVTAAQQDGTHGALLFLDLDHFKRANDALGHLAGDKLLRKAVERLRSALPADHLLARLGGDEFTLLCPARHEMPDVPPLADSLIDLFRDAFTISGRPIVVGLSIGSVGFPADGSRAEDLLRRADTAMYQAKRAGRNRHVAFQAHMEQEILASLELDDALHRALGRQEFRLHYQPQVDARSNALVGAEALIRWQHPEKGLVGPGNWIPQAEENGLIDDIGAWALREACAQLLRWDADDIHVPRLAVNVSAKQLLGDSFQDIVMMTLTATGLAPERLELEITESQLMINPDVAIPVLRALSELGIGISIDDFGTGYSSFGQLRKLPLAALKVDRSFIQDVDCSTEAHAVVQAIIQMAHALELKVVAEGVETPAQRAAVTTLHCDAIQGYVVARPTPPHEFAIFARSHGSADAPA